MTEFNTMSLGEIINELKQYDKNSLCYFHAPFKNAQIYIEKNGHLMLNSYRGYHEHLAIQFCMDYEETKEYNVTVEKLIEALEYANGRTFNGHKGGNYKIDLDTPVWCSMYGNTGYRITKVERNYSDKYDVLLFVAFKYF